MAGAESLSAWAQVPAGGAVNVTLFFRPPTVGPKASALVVSSNDPVPQWPALHPVIPPYQCTKVWPELSSRGVPHPSWWPWPGLPSILISCTHPPIKLSFLLGCAGWKACPTFRENVGKMGGFFT